MANISVIGLGNYGTALAVTWLNAGHRVCGWTIEEDVCADIQQNQVNGKYLPDVSLAGMKATTTLSEALDGYEIVVLSVPSHVLLNVLEDMLPLLTPQQVIIDVAKGLGPDGRLLSDVIEERLQQAGLPNALCVMVGPTIAPELARGIRTTALVAGRDEQIVGRLVNELATDTFHLSAGSDPTGVELWAAFKNVIALMCGLSDGIAGGGDNLKAALFTAGFAEAVRLLPLLGADPATALTPAGIGDLFVTATSKSGRNRSLGERLGQGMSLAEARQQTVMVAEGVPATQLFSKLAKEKALDAPFVQTAQLLLDGQIDVQDCVRRLIDS